MRVVLALCLAIGMACGDVVHAETVTCEDGKAMLQVGQVKGQMTGENGPLTCKEYQAWYQEVTSAMQDAEEKKMEEAVTAAEADIAKYTAEVNALEARRVKDLEVSRTEGYREGYHDCTIYVLEQVTEQQESRSTGWWFK